MNHTISSEDLNHLFLPVLGAQGGHYRKFTTIRARAALTGETIVTRTNDGKETENTANQDDLVVENDTEAKEQYIVSAKKFANRYQLIRELDELWSEYQAVGEILAIEVDQDTITTLGGDSEAIIEAPWGGTQPVKKGDYLATPLPAKNEIYRIAAEEFAATYQSAT